MYFQDLYTNLRIRSRLVLFQQTGLALGCAFLIQALLVYLRQDDLILPAWLMIWGSALAFVAVPLWRILYGGVVWKGVGSERILFLGTSALVRDISRYALEHRETGFVPVGFVDDGACGREVDGVPVLGQMTELERIVAESHPDRIVVGIEERRARLPVNQLLDLRFSGIQIQDCATTYEAAFGRVSTRELRPSQLIFSDTLGPHSSFVTLQSIYSTMIAAVGLLLTLPLMLLSAAAVALSSRGPVIYRQKRVGKDNRPFTLYKFRSMRNNVEAKSGAVWATKDDPRVTGVGRWLRRLRLDELPQLFNVLKGEMSIVGPRPERPEFVADLEKRIPYYRQRHCVKPGITGWAQINHKYGDTVEDTITKLEYDLYYIKNLAPALDAYIMFQTLKVMLLSRGAQ
jgi:sugar transferase (PEP-CTERM system associated)